MRYLSFCVSAVLLLSVGCGTDHSVPRDQVAESRKINAGAFPHADLDLVLRRFSSDGFVDYESLKKSKTNLNRFLVAVSKASPDQQPKLFATKAEKLAYYVNAYNALVLENVCSKWPLEDLSSNLTKLEFFINDSFVVGGRRINLNDFEKKVILPALKEPRLHFALNCASYGCPRLPSEAFDPSRVDEQLDRETRKFVLESRNVEVKSKSKTLVLSKIFEWYQSDFANWGGVKGESDFAKVVAFINKYRPADKQLPKEVLEWTIEYREYDWRVNSLQNAPAEVQTRLKAKKTIATSRPSPR